MLTLRTLGKTLVFVLLTFGFFQFAYAAEDLTLYDPIDVQPGSNMSKICKTIVGNPNEYLRSTVKLQRFIRGRWRVVPKSQYNLIFPGDRVLVLKSRTIEAQSQVGQNSIPKSSDSINAPIPKGNAGSDSANSNTQSNSNSQGAVNSFASNSNVIGVVSNANSNSNTTGNASGETSGNQGKSNNDGKPSSDVVAQPEEVRNYRLAILSFILITLGLLSFIFVKVAYPYIVSLWHKSEKDSDVRQSQRLKDLAEYLNREAHENFELDLETWEDASRRSFQASEENKRLVIKATGIEQSKVHEFLEAAFVGLNLTAENHGLKTGLDEQLRYFSEWTVTSSSLNYTIPDANLITLFARREHMREAGKKIAAKLKEPYEPGTVTTEFVVDARNGIMDIVFTPTGLKNDFYGSKDTPNEYYADAKTIVEQLTVGKTSDSRMDRFSFIDYCRDAKTQISTVTVRLKLVEENENVKNSNPRS